jgi:replicative DNA helicase
MTLDSANTANSASRDRWQQPRPLAEVQVPIFPVVALPDWLCEFVEAEALATQTPPDLAAMLGLAVCAAAAARKVEVQVKEGWREPINLWPVVALPPGSRKTAVFRDVTRPIEEFETERSEQLAPSIAESQARRRITETALKRAEDRAANAKPMGRDELIAVATTLARELAEAAVPVAPRLVVDDCSPERLATLLRDHGRIAVLSPEGDAFDIMAGRYSSGTPNLGVYLRGHAGDTLRVDRVNRPPEHVERPALTMGLAVQPDVLRGLVDKPSFRGRGLLGRFLYAIPESTVGCRLIDPDPVPAHVTARYRHELRRLLTLDCQAQPHVLAFGDEARAIFRDFEATLEPRLAEGAELGGIADWGAKLAGAIARIAAVIHLADSREETPWDMEVTAATVQRAIKIANYLVPHALAAFALMGSNEEVEEARHLLAWIEKRGVTEFTKREAFEGTKGRFRRADALDRPLGILIEHGFIKHQPHQERTGPGRKPSPGYDVHPSVGSRISHYSQNAA